ncbi:MAG: diguanylate cyclase [Desulfovibrio sp.]|nr:diguanylate cyclase [Desulfovibrio sp.]
MHLRTTLRISLLGLAEDLCQTLEHVPAAEPFLFVFSREIPSSFPTQTLRARDLILVGDIACCPSCRGPGVRPILIERGSRAHSQEELALFDDIWRVQGEAELLFYFRRYLSRLETFCTLHRKELYLETMLATTPDLVWFKNTDGLYFSVSSTFSRTAKKSREDIEGRGHAYIWDMDEEEYKQSPLACKESDARVLTTGSVDVSDELVKTTRGIRTFSTCKGALKDDDGEIIGTAGIAHDVTDMNTLAAELNLLLGSLPFAVVMTDEHNRIVNINNRFKKLFGQSGEPPAGSATYYPGEDRRGSFASILSRELREMSVPEEIARNGKDVVLDLQQKEILDRLGNRVGLVVILRDVTDEHNNQLLLEKHAYEDSLTGLFNRRYFYEKISRRMNGGGLIYLDLDNFKFLNDCCGHRAGDECLRIVGAVLKDTSPDAVRMGGDEFAIYLPGADLSALETAAHRIVHETEARFAGSSLSVVTMSIGIAVCDNSPEQMDDLVCRADIAMYTNKQLHAEYNNLCERKEHMSDGVSKTTMDDLDGLIRARESRLTPFTVYKKGMHARPDGSNAARSRR